MTRAVRIERTGGPEVIEWGDIDLPDPAEGEIRMRNTAVGLNFIDVYHRKGVYPLTMPSGLGSEAAGVVEAVGTGVDGFQVGDRIGIFGPSRGAYATARNVPAGECVHLPDDVSDEVAAALLLKGCTTEFLVERCAMVQQGQVVLVWAAAGGVGHLLVGWLKAIGSVVIGVAGGAEKVASVTRAGADHVIDHRSEDVAQRVRAITEGVGVPVIFDGVGAATWDASLASAARRGLIVSYGNAGGPVEGVKMATLAARGSLFVTRPTLFDYCVTPQEKRASVDRVFTMLRGGDRAGDRADVPAGAGGGRAPRAGGRGDTREHGAGGVASARLRRCALSDRRPGSPHRRWRRRPHLDW